MNTKPAHQYRVDRDSRTVICVSNGQETDLNAQGEACHTDADLRRFIGELMDQSFFSQTVADSLLKDLGQGSEDQYHDELVGHLDSHSGGHAGLGRARKARAKHLWTHAEEQKYRRQSHGDLGNYGLREEEARLARLARSRAEVDAADSPLKEQLATERAAEGRTEPDPDPFAFAFGIPTKQVAGGKDA